MIKAIEAGADVIDTALSPLGMGTSHPATESMVAALKGTEYDTGLDLVALNELTKYFRTLRTKYLESGLLNPKMLEVDTNALIYQVPDVYKRQHAPRLPCAQALPGHPARGHQRRADREI